MEYTGSLIIRDKIPVLGSDINATSIQLSTACELSIDGSEYVEYFKGDVITLKDALKYGFKKETHIRLIGGS